jgi:hypothetical protein
MYFDLHNVIKYNGENVVDIFRKNKIYSDLRNNPLLFENYDVRDRESPEILSYRLYGSTDYHWVLLLINNIVNINTDWTLSVRDFGNFVSNKYSNPDAVHHYEDSDGDTVSITTSYPVTNYTFEERINDVKAKILILKPENLDLFVSNFKELL